MGEPTTTATLLAVLSTPTSAIEVKVVGSLAASLLRFSSPPPPMVPLSVSGLDAAWATATVIATGGYALPAASASDRVQVTVWPAIEQVQPAPDAAVGVSPAGTVSVMVTRPLVDA